MRARFDAVRARTRQLAAPLSAEDCCAQSMPDASPVKWHLAHTTWFFETFLLEARESDFRPFHPAYRVLFNSYYHGVGERHPRPLRGSLTRPCLAEVLAYRDDVERRMRRLLDEQGGDPALRALAELGLQHEQQHQELILTDVKHLLSANPAFGGYDARPLAPAAMPALAGWLRHEGGLADIGHGGGGFAFDNESPRHRQVLAPFELAERLVTNGEYLRFVEDGGYANPSHWLAEGWEHARGQGWEHPAYWRREDGRWLEYTLHGLVPLDPARPVCHVSLYEADAYAQWAGARLPTEAEWEAAAGGVTEAAPDGGWPLHPDAAGRGLSQLYGACWQWTSSSYSPYPGFRPAPGAIGEYNGKFMVNQYVLRGGSCATPAGHARATYRNFFPAAARWQFSGIRLARSQ